MSWRVLRRLAFWGIGAGVMACALSVESRAAGSLTVNPGYDLFTSTEGTTFPGLGDLVGVPLGTYDFGTGAVGVGDADTIVHRLSEVTVAAIGDTGTTRLELLALQLMTAAPVDFGGLGLDNYFVTLQSARGGPASLGSMDITFTSLEGGTFTSFFDVFFDIRKGSLDGPIVFSDELTLTNSGADWTRTPPPGAILIDGINHFLNGTDNATDFWPVTPFVEQHPSGAKHEVTVASVPEPGSLVMGTTALVVGLVILRSRQRP
ncbi:hypothetical protein [Aquisphaera insulae]|uniref:hypothetical protein n=1 Tax=Aquisphaera insulae TaxID=2712864 RepID=UPI0013EC8360|nr:hypothetical protein [Aquisphaera insulae]